MTVPTSKEPKEKMRYSNSWPDRAITVKVRVNPVSRAYTIIPTFSDDPLPDVTTSQTKNDVTIAERKNDVTYSEERDKRSTRVEPMIKNSDMIDTNISNLTDNIWQGVGETDEKPIGDVPVGNSEGIDGSRITENLRNFSTNDTSLSLRKNGEPIKSQQPSIKPKGTSADSSNVEFSSYRANRYLPNSLHLSLKSLRKNVSPIDDVATRGSARLVKSVSNLATLESKLSSRSELNEKRDCHVNSIVTDGKLFLKRDVTSVVEFSNDDKASHSAISTCNVDQREVKPPVIRIIDYDRVSNRLAKNWETEHACPKCKSDDFLELQIDPFRSGPNKTSSKPGQKTRNNCVETGTFPDRRFRSRSTTYDFRSDLGKTFGRRTKSFAGNSGAPTNPNETTVRSPLTIDHRKEITLRRHYYPEGGWGYVVVTCSVLVHFLGIGLQLAAPGSWHLSAERKFHHPPLHSAEHRCSTFGAQTSSAFETEWNLGSDELKCLYIAQCTIRQHYYPESGWGWVVVVTGVMVQILAAGIHGAAGIWLVEGMKKYRQPLVNVGWLGAMSTGVALLVSPVTIAFCRKKSTRVTAVLGGLVTALGCLFTSFASQFHQLFFSYGTVVGIGVGMTRDCSTLMVAQYFKRRREFVEIFIVSGSGLGIAVMSAFIKGAISKIGWRLGLQAVTGVVFLTFILGTFYRSASLYHPQRRAILHLKNQKRKIKDKNRVDDRPPFFDFSTLKSKTVRILLVSTGISAFGINTPIFYLAHQAEEEGLGDTVVLLQTYLGLAWTLGCVAFGLLVVHHSVECRIARQYLTQAAVFMCGLCILALTAVHGNYHGYVMFTWIYGIFCGGYHYSLKMYTYERVRARNFARTWGFVQCSQAIPIAIGVPISGYMNVGCGGKAGYYFSSTCVLVGSFTLFFIDLHRRNLSRHKHTRANGTRHLCVSDNCPQRRRLSFTQDPENEGVAAGAAAAALVLGAELAPGQGEIIDALGADKPELTCISEEGIADMDLPDNLLDDLDYIGDCITSCNKVENYLMLSEFENNLIAEMPIIMDRKGRRWSLARSKPGPQASQSGNGNGNGNNANGQSATLEEDEETKVKWHLAPTTNNRVITVIDEAST